MRTAAAAAARDDLHRDELFLLHLRARVSRAQGHTLESEKVSVYRGREKTAEVATTRTRLNLCSELNACVCVCAEPPHRPSATPWVMVRFKTDLRFN